jgi:hypothetical protein
MSRARHRAKGGKVVAYTAGDSNVMKEAHERKRGGGVHHHGEGEEAKHHAGKRARGGKVARKHGGKVEALGHGHHHVGAGHHEYKRARGGAVGSDKRPLSSAAIVKHLPEEKGGGAGAGPANEQTDH